MNAEPKKTQTNHTVRYPSGAKNCWLVVDPDGSIYARVSRCKLKIARAIARVAFPEMEGELNVVPWGTATKKQRVAGEALPLFTPEILERQGISLPVSPPTQPPRPPVEFLPGKLQEQLQKHFARAAGGGA